MPSRGPRVLRQARRDGLPCQQQINSARLWLSRLADGLGGRDCGTHSSREHLDKKRRLREALAEGRPVPSELRTEENALRRELELDDALNDGRAAVAELDDEYARAGISDPKVVITTCRDPSVSRCAQSKNKTTSLIIFLFFFYFDYLFLVFFKFLLISFFVSLFLFFFLGFIGQVDTICQRVAASLSQRSTLQSWSTRCASFGRSMSSIGRNRFDCSS